MTTDLSTPNPLQPAFVHVATGAMDWMNLNTIFFTETLRDYILQAANDSTNPVTLCFDLDLTLFPFNENPEDVTIDSLAKQALQDLLALNIPNLEIVAITGRSIDQAQRMLQGLHIKIIGDHGLVEISPDGERREFPIPECVIQAKNEAYLGLQNALKELPENQQAAVVLEQKEYSTGFKIVDPSQFNDDEAKAFINNLKTIMREHITSGLSAIACESDAEAELRPEAGKETGMEYFLGIGTERYTGKVVFFCDSLDPTGTDRKAAEMVSRLGGHVVRVVGERDSSFHPAQGISPAALCYKASGLGKCLTDLAQVITPRFTSPYPSPGLRQEL